MSDAVVKPPSSGDDPSAAAARGESETLEAPPPTLASQTPDKEPSSSRYVVLEEVGRGGMGRVLRAYDPRLQREVALKEVRDDPPDPRRTQRLVAEARAMAKLSQRNVVAVFDVEELASGRVLLVMEYVAGQTLKQWLRSAQRSQRDILSSFVDAGRGLQAAHEVGLLHRDFKPSNVLVAQDGTLKVTDFGLAKAQAAVSRGESVETSDTGDDLTEAGTVVGTPRFMAPEQHAGEALTPAADQYAFCIALWEALCGAPPFRGLAIAQRKHVGPPAWPDPSVPQPVAKAIVRGLSPEPSERWPSMRELLELLAPRAALHRGRWLIGVGAVGLASIVGVGYDAWSNEREQSCTAARDALAGIWDDDRRSAVQAAFEGVGRPYAADAWTRAQRRLDEYADGWVAMHTEACEATAVTKTQAPEVLDLRMTCLQRAKTSLQAVVDTLAEADASVVQRAYRVTDGMPPLRRCSDVEALRAQVVPPSAGDRDAVEAARTKLSRAETLRAAGRYQEARDIVDDADATLVGIQYEPVWTEIALVRGLVLRNLGDYEGSEAALQEVLRRGVRSAQWDDVRHAVVQLVHVVGHEQKRFDAVSPYRSLAEGLTASDPIARAGLKNSVALLLHAQGKLPEAEAAHRTTLALRQDALGDDDPAVAESRNNLAMVLGDQGKFTEAETHFRAALAVRQTALGTTHPQVAESHNNIAIVLADQGKYEESARQHRTARQLWEGALGSEHPYVALSRGNLATVLRAQGKHAEAEAEHRASLAVFVRVRGPDHPAVASSRNNLANALEDQGKYAEAEAEHRIALAIRLDALGPAHPHVGASHNNLGSVLARQGKLEEAELELRAAISVWTSALGADHPAVAQARHNLALALRDLGRTDAALKMVEHAWARRQRDDIPAHERAETAFLLAELLWDVAPTLRDRAVTLARDAVASYDAANASHDGERQDVQRWLDRRQ